MLRKIVSVCALIAFAMPVNLACAPRDEARFEASSDKPIDIAANEKAAVVSMRVISTAQVAFQAAGKRATSDSKIGEYGPLKELGDGPDPYIDETLASGVKDGYKFELQVPPLDETNNVPRYQATAIPVEPGKTGVARYFVDESGVIRATHDGADPTAASEPIK